MDLSSVFDKKWGILIKKESESLDFIGLRIPRDYYIGTCDGLKEGMKLLREIADYSILAKRRLLNLEQIYEY